MQVVMIPVSPKGNAVPDMTLSRTLTTISRAGTDLRSEASMLQRTAAKVARCRERTVPAGQAAPSPFRTCSSNSTNRGSVTFRA
jgi:hypothetical protein